jgi:hypothetical protein
MCTPATLPKLQHATRCEVFNALFNLLQTLPPPSGSKSWKTVSQTVLEFDEVPAANQPAIILVRGPQNFTLKAVGTTKLHWRCFFLIYFRVDNQKTSSNRYPDQITDPIMDSIEQLFTPVMFNQYFTLGGLVQNCWLDGNAVADPGVVDGQAIIFVPISIIL